MTRKILVRIAICLGVLGSLGFFQSNENVNAALWAQGTPRILRGRYQGKRISSVEGFGYTVLVTKNAIIEQTSNSPQFTTSHLFYQKIAHNVFKFSGFAHGGPGTRGAFAEFVVALKGRALVQDSYKNYKKYGIRKILLRNPVKRVRKWRMGGPIYHY